MRVHKRRRSREHYEQNINLTLTFDPALVSAISELSENLGKWLGQLEETVRVGFDDLIEAVENNNPPPPAFQRGNIVARYRVPANAPDVVYSLVGNGFTDDEGNPTGAQDIDLSLEIINPAAVTATLGPQTLSADGQEVTADVTLHFESPQVDQAVVNEKATNRDTAAVVAARSNEYIVGPGEATIGTLGGEIPLEAEPEQ